MAYNRTHKHKRQWNKGGERKPFVKKEFEPKPQGLTVIVRNNDIQKAMRKLKKMLLKEGVMQELRDRRYYQKPSFKKREDKKRAIRRAAKLRREQEMAEFGIIKKKARR